MNLITKIKSVDWNHVTKYSQILAIVLFVGVFALGFWLGKTYEYRAFTNSLKEAHSKAAPDSGKSIADVTYSCNADKFLHALYFGDHVSIAASDGRNLYLPLTPSASGAHYTNQDESVVFWNEGNTAFITEGKKTTFENCIAKPIPE